MAEEVGEAEDLVADMPANEPPSSNLLPNLVLSPANKHVSKALEVGEGEHWRHARFDPHPSHCGRSQGKEIGAGAVYDGRGLAENLAWGAQAMWVGTRFVACEEAGAPPMHKKAIVNAGHEDFARTLIYTGRPLRVIRSPYIDDWENNRLLARAPDHGLISRVAAQIREVLPAKKIIEDMVNDAARVLKHNASLVDYRAKL